MSNGADWEFARRKLEDLARYSAKSQSREDPHKNNPEPVRGGCGNPGCPICYDQRTGQLRDESGKYGTGRGGASVSEMAYQDFWAQNQRPIKANSGPPSTFTAVRESVKQWLIEPGEGVSWDSVIGNDRAKAELREAIEASTTHAKLYSHYEMTAPKGVMLWGPPGCGKTMLGKASAAAIGRAFGAKAELMLLNGAELESPIVGIAAQKVRSVFAYAREYSAWKKHPLVIFIDEADAMLKSRESSPWASELVGQFLAEMDGLRAAGAFVILATNRPDELDEALLREGRIDRKIKIERPNAAIARIIAEQSMPKGSLWLGEWDLGFVDYLFEPKHLLSEIINPETHAKHHFTLGHIVSGAMIVGLIARAKSRAFRRDLVIGGEPNGVGQADLLAAVDEVLAENKGLNHDYALREFVIEVALPAEAARLALRRMN